MWLTTWCLVPLFYRILLILALHSRRLVANDIVNPISTRLDTTNNLGYGINGMSGVCSALPIAVNVKNQATIAA